MSRVAFRRFSSFLHIRGDVTRSRLVADYVIPLSHSSRIPLLLMLFLLCPLLLVVLCISLFFLNKCFFFTRTSRTNEDFKRTTASILVKALRTIQKASDICQDSNYATSLVGEKGYRKVWNAEWWTNALIVTRKPSSKTNMMGYSDSISKQKYVISLHIAQFVKLQ